MKIWTATDCAKQYLGMKEVPGHKANPAILAMLKMDMDWPADDSVPWCSGFANWVAWNMGLQRTRSLRARSWLKAGVASRPGRESGNCVVVFSRGRWAPGPEVIKAPGHVAFFDGFERDRVWVVGGNQGDKVSRRSYPRSCVLGIRQLSRIA